MLIGDIQWISKNEIAGWVANSTDESSDITVSLAAEGMPSESVLANLSKPDLGHIRNGNCGFSIAIDDRQYLSIITRIADNIKDIGLTVTCGNVRQRLFIGDKLYRNIINVAGKNESLAFENNAVVRTRYDGRIYLTGGSNKNKAFLTGEIPLDEATVRYWTSEIEKITTFCNENNKIFTLLCVCAKENFEFAGADFHISPQRPVATIYNALSEAARRNFRYSRQAMLRILPEERKFIANDTHINAFGTFALYKIISERHNFPLQNILNVENIRFFYSVWEGDLARNISGNKHTVATEFSGKPDEDLEVHTPFDNVELGRFDTRMKIYGHSTGKMLYNMCRETISEMSYERKLFPQGTDELKDLDHIVCVVPERYLARALEN